MSDWLHWSHPCSHNWHPPRHYHGWDPQPPRHNTDLRRSIYAPSSIPHIAHQSHSFENEDYQMNMIELLQQPTWTVSTGQSMFCDSRCLCSTCGPCPHSPGVRRTGGGRGHRSWSAHHTRCWSWDRGDIVTTIMKMMRSPLTLVMRRTLGAGLVTSGLLHPVDAFVEVAEVLVAQQRAVAVIDTGLALTAMGKVLISKI